MGEDQEVISGHVQFERSNRYPKWRDQASSQEFKIKITAGDRVESPHMWMLFKAMRLEEITKGMCR